MDYDYILFVLLYNNIKRLYCILSLRPIKCGMLEWALEGVYAMTLELIGWNEARLSIVQFIHQRSYLGF